MKAPIQELLQQLKEVVTQSTCYDEIVSGVSLIVLNDNYWTDKEQDFMDRQYEQGWENAIKHINRMEKRCSTKNTTGEPL